MIKLRLGAFGNDNGDLLLPISEGDTVKAAADKILSHAKVDYIESDKIFHAVVNGIIIPPELWQHSNLKPSDQITFTPKMGDADSANSFVRLALVAVAVATFGGAGGLIAQGFGLNLASNGVGVALLNLGVTCIAGAATMALIPPPVLEQEKELKTSQMYTISAQGNGTKKYGFVPKVYGQHRMFPTIAANPYTEILADPTTGELSQYVTAIYDFGLGPCHVGDIKIGDTPLYNYKEYSMNFVDPNKPAVSEGVWDDQTQKEFTLYKGAVTQESMSIALNGNRDAGSPQSEYQVIRSAADNVDGTKQEITLTFVNPEGLVAYASNGTGTKRNIDLEIHYRKVGTNDWKAYNDPNNSEAFEVVGGYDVQTNTEEEVYLGPASPETPYTYLSTPYYNCGGGFSTTDQTWGFVARTDVYGLKAGTYKVYLKESDGLFVGASIKIDGKYIGKIVSVAAFSGAYKEYTLDRPIQTDIALKSVELYGEYTPVPNQVRAITAYGSKIQSTQVNVGKARLSRDLLGAVTSTVKFTPIEKASFEVRVSRIVSFSDYSSTVYDKLSLAGLTTRFDTLPIRTDKRHTFMELRIKATNQLNGSIQNLSGMVSSVVDVYEGGTWVKKFSSNPAWIFADILTGQVNKRPVPKSRLHLPSLLEWAAFCDEIPDAPPSRTFVIARFTTNFILDYESTVQKVLNQVAGAAQASINITDGKYGVLLDKKRTVPTQIFTTRNSRDFSSTKAFTPRPHGLKVKFVYAAANWDHQELEVYDDGYDASNATVFEEVQTFAVTNPEQAWRFGRFLLAQNRLRQEIMTLTVDFEHLVCSRGDFVQIQQDVMKVGGTPARVRSVSGNQITIDEGIEAGPGTYGYVFRSIDGTIYSDTLTFVDSDTMDLDGPTMPGVGDLIVIGLVDYIVYDCMVKSITPNEDMSAQLVLVEKADAVYDSESTDDLPDYNPQLSPTVSADFAPPPEVDNLTVTDNFWYCSGGGYVYYIDIDWDAPPGAAYENFEVYCNTGRGYNFISALKGSVYRYTVQAIDLNRQHDFKVIAVSSSGKKLDLGSVTEVSATPLKKITPPSDVMRFNSDITGETLQFFWDRIADCDCDRYLIRYSPTLDGTWDTSIPLMNVSSATSLVSTQARTGTYLIKAIDYNGNESLAAATVITTIPELFGLNLIEEITDFPALPGVKDVTEELVAGELILQRSILGDIYTTEYYSEGFYYYDSLLDLGEVYTVRLQSLIRASGFNQVDLLSNWPTLDLLTQMATIGSSDWDVEAQYRSSTSFAAISGWNPLSDVSFMSVGDDDQFSPWRKFVIGDATGRIFQFRLRLISNKPSVTPRVYDGTIKVDMPDRVDSYTNLSAPDTGYSLVYTPAFAGPGTSPNIQISIDSAQSGDYWTITSKTLEGFDIQFFDKNNVAVSRQFDAQVKGYGRKALTAL